MKTAQEIAAAINATGKTYFGDRAKGWDKGDCRRVYFGRDYVTIETDDTVHAKKPGKVAAKTAGYEAVELVQEAMAN